MPAEYSAPAYRFTPPALQGNLSRLVFALRYSQAMSNPFGEATSRRRPTRLIVMTLSNEEAQTRRPMWRPSKAAVERPPPSSTALSEQRQVVCVGRSTRRPKRRLGREGAPLGQRGGAPLFVNLAGDEMALLIEMVVDLGMN